MTYTINIEALANPITDEQFERLCAQNPETKFETNAKGELIIMSPTGSDTGRKNSDLNYQIQVWNRQYKLGVVFDSSTGFKLPVVNTKRSPDVSWIAIDRWNALSKQEKTGFAPIAPDFVIELMSPTDNLTDVQKKMEEYMISGVKLGWLINPKDEQVEIYRQDQEKEIKDNPKLVPGETILPGLVVNLKEIF